MSLRQRLNFCNKGRPNKSKALTTKTWYLGRVYKMRRKIANRWVEYREPVDLLDQTISYGDWIVLVPKDHGSIWTYDLTYYIMIDLKFIFPLAIITFVVEKRLV